MSKAIVPREFGAYGKAILAFTVDSYAAARDRPERSIPTAGEIDIGESLALRAALIEAERTIQRLEARVPNPDTTKAHRHPVTPQPRGSNKPTWFPDDHWDNFYYLGGGYR